MSEAELVADSEEMTFPVRVAARMTGLTPELLRAWERRYAAVEPVRTEGGTRRYTAAHLKRLRLLRQAVDAGIRISEAAQMDSDVLRQRVTPRAVSGGSWIGEVITALHQLDSQCTRMLLEKRAEEVGLAEFARESALPLLYEIGEQWKVGALSVAAEHLATSLIRSMLASDLFARSSKDAGPTLVFATPSGEDHDLGLLIASLTAAEAGANIIFLGANMPAKDLVESVESGRADVLALGLVTLATEEATRFLVELRGALPAHVAIWVGGGGAKKCPPIQGVDPISNLDQVSANVSLLAVGGAEAAG